MRSMARSDGDGVYAALFLRRRCYHSPVGHMKQFMIEKQEGNDKIVVKM